MVQGCSAIKEILGSSRWWSIAFSSGDKTNSILGQMFPEVRLCRLDGMKLRGMCSPLLGPFKIPVAVADPIADSKASANVVRPSFIVLCSTRVGHKQPPAISMAVQIRHLHGALAARNFRRRGWNRASYEPVQMALLARFLGHYLFLDVLRVPANDEIFERKEREVLLSFLFRFSCLYRIKKCATEHLRLSKKEEQGDRCKDKRIERGRTHLDRLKVWSCR